MTTTTVKKTKKMPMDSRVNKLIGQLEAFKRTFSGKKDGYELIMLLAACRGALNAITIEVIESHIENKILNSENQKMLNKSGKKLIDIMKSFWT